MINKEYCLPKCTYDSSNHNLADFFGHLQEPLVYSKQWNCRIEIVCSTPAFSILHFEMIFFKCILAAVEILNTQNEILWPRYKGKCGMPDKCVLFSRRNHFKRSVLLKMHEKPPGSDTSTWVISAENCQRRWASSCGSSKVIRCVESGCWILHARAGFYFKLSCYYWSSTPNGKISSRISEVVFGVKYSKAHVS